MCDFCGEEYEGLGVQVNLDCGMEICPDCLLAGPKAVAEKMRTHPHKDAGMEGMPEFLHDAAEVIGGWIPSPTPWIQPEDRGGVLAQRAGRLTMGVGS
jgi:hypothetical protein